MRFQTKLRKLYVKKELKMYIVIYIVSPIIMVNQTNKHIF